MITASIIMKLISLVTLLATVSCQKNQHDQFPFPPKFQTPSSIIFSSDSSVYLPPEPHTPVPYYASNNINKLPFQFLPPSVTKSPNIFSTPFPIMVSSIFKSNMDDDDENENEDDKVNNRRTVIMRPQNNMNFTSTHRQLLDKREAKSNIKIPNYQAHINKFDFKTNYVTPTAPVQNSAARRMIITSELQRSDPNQEQEKAPSFQNSQYVHPSGVFISSTTEPSIPILRLSNEMDLDGSFSYEALGADQTHYVQHSRMENMGTDKEEQVVEGSYSYVGDDGRTYTVHYVADSNGYRATGDHLPVPPPVPEIIQRAVQYNLAEEAKKPPHLKSSWENDENDYREESREETKLRYFNIPPPRNLFTGKTPEAFSFGFSQGTNSQSNLATAASFQAPSKINFDATMNPSKPNLNVTPILPQITFLASQGTHNPSQQLQTSVTKSISSEKSSLPSLMHYEADKKSSDDEANKALWRWQYGLNSNINQVSNKNSISRSSSEGDDIVINFNDMTPEQYTNMIQSQVFGHNIEEPNKAETYNQRESSSTPFNRIVETYDDYKFQEIDAKTNKYGLITPTEKINFHSKLTDTKPYSNMQSTIISSHNFIPHSQIATQSYNVEVSTYEPTQINALNENYTKYQSNTYNNAYFNNQYIIPDNLEKQTTTGEPISNTIIITKETEIKTDDKDSFKPILYREDKNLLKEKTEITTQPMEEKIRNNIFLKQLFKSSSSSNNEEKPLKQDDFQNNLDIELTTESRVEKISKHIEYQQKPQNEIKVMPPKPLDMSDILNYVIMKNHFESIKTRPKNNPQNSFNQNGSMKEASVQYIPIKQNYNDQENKREEQEQENDYRALNNQQQQELHGLIKNYKILQRNKNLAQKNPPVSEPQRHIKAFHTPGLPPLGRAGPSLKSYLPPTYV